MGERRVSKWKRPIIEELAILLDIPTRTAEAAVNSVYNSMKASLLRGEEVRVTGFGILRWRTTPAHRKYLSLFNSIEMRPKLNKVYFEPSKALLRYINQCS